MNDNELTPDFQPVETLTYSQASAELETILRKMQGNECDIDLLAAYTKRATALIAECRKRLTATDEELKAILGDLQQPQC